MPRRPNSSRPGCWTCKKRHRRCDESRPVCQKCALHGEECEGYGAQRLAFRNYTASVQRNHGHGLPPPTGPLHGIMLDLDLDREDLVVLKEFVESLSHELALTESHNIWRDDIAPLISESDGRERHLLHALLAVTLMYRTHLEHRITYDAAMHYDVAVSDLRVALDAVDSQQPGQLDSVFATLFLLTWFEIFAGDWEKWNIHLIAIANLFRTLEPCQVSQSRFRRRLICALARLDVPNTIWNLNPPLLSRQLYALMLFPDGAYAEDDLEDAAVLAFHRLHVMMAQFAEVYADWLHGSAEASVATHMAAILGELDYWHSKLPLGLQLPDTAEASSPPRTTLQSTLLIHYLSMKLFALHVLDPDCALPHAPAYPFCRGLALKVCSLISSLGSPSKRNSASFRGDVGVILPLSIVSMFLCADAERAWICDWVRQVKYEGMWCGRRRAMIIEAWAKCERELMSCVGRPLHTMVGEDNIYWKPGEGLNVCIMTYDPVEDRRSTVQIYIDGNAPSNRRIQ